MNEPARIETTVIPITRGKELKDRILYPYKPEVTNSAPAMRRLAQCLAMAAELLLEIYPS